MDRASACALALDAVVSAEIRVRVSQDTQGWPVHRAAAERHLSLYARAGCPPTDVLTVGPRAGLGADVVRSSRGMPPTATNQVLPLGGPMPPPTRTPARQRPFGIASPHPDSKAPGSERPDSERNLDGDTGLPCRTIGYDTCNDRRARVNAT